MKNIFPDHCSPKFGDGIKQDLEKMAVRKRADLENFKKGVK